MTTKFPVEKFSGIETPFYYYDVDLLRNTLGKALEEAGKYVGFHVHYAIKANFNSRLLKIMADAGLGADCVSGGEVAAALEAGVPASKIVFAGVGKTDKGVCLDGDMICRDGKPVLNRKDILIPGEHNVENYMAAILAVEDLVDDEIICQVAKTFGGVEHRIELVRIKDGVRFYNDSIASTPSRTIAGLRSFPEKVLLIAGGYDKHIPYDVLGPVICRHVKTLFVNGATAKQIRTAVEQSPEYTPGCPCVVDCTDFTDAVNQAVAASKSGDVVLMSPASAAFDQFKNFMERGKYFKKMIMEL